MSVIKKDTIQRLINDVKQIVKNPLTENGIYYIHDDTDMLKGYAMIVGPEETPYFGGFYFFKLSYPTDYPHSPPKVTYCTNGKNIRFNPNLYTCGKVCVSLLNTWNGDQWTSCQTISTVLLTLCTLLCANPLLNEPGVYTGHPDINDYSEAIEFANLDIAICNIMEKKKGIFMPFFENFYPFIKEQFSKNIEKLLVISENKNQKFNKTPIVIKTKMYSINITADYSNIIERLNKLKGLLV
jgi:ubiquitin-protein ligase